MAVVNYHDVEGHYPPPYIADKDGRPIHSWRVLILPYMEQQDLYKEYRLDEPWDGPNNRKLAHRMPKAYALHGEYRPGRTITNYFAVVGPTTVWRSDKAVTDKDVKDGLANTIMIVENRGLDVHWMEPRDLDVDTMDWNLQSPRGISSRYKDPAIVTLDDQVRRLSPRMKPDVLRALFTIAGGEPLGDSAGGWERIPDGRDRPVTDP